MRHLSFYVFYVVSPRFQRPDTPVLDLVPIRSLIEDLTRRRNEEEIRAAFVAHLELWSGYIHLPLRSSVEYRCFIFLTLQ